jgi:HK97 family phage major capsid protein
MPTTRESLELAVAELESFSDELDAKEKTGRLSAQDVAKLNERTAKVKSLCELFKGKQAVDAASGPPVDDKFAVLANMGGNAAGHGPAQATKSASLGASPLAFSEADLRSLHEAALDRHVQTKATLDTSEAPMALVGDYRMSVWPTLRDRVRILDYLPVERTVHPTVHFFRALTGANAAAAVPEGADKPESTPTWETAYAPVQKLAHYARVNDEVIADFADFRRVIGDEMIAGLIAEENDQLLNGNGTPPNISGLLDATTTTIGSAGTDLDAIATAMNLIRTTVYLEPDIVIMHPNDWASTGFLLAKETTGAYMLGDALTSLSPRLWGVPVVLTTAMPENSALVANLKDAARAYVRQTPTLEVQPGGGTAEFIANQTLIRAEERLALAVVRPTALVIVTGV